MILERNLQPTCLRRNEQNGSRTQSATKIIEAEWAKWFSGAIYSQSFRGGMSKMILERNLKPKFLRRNGQNSQVLFLNPPTQHAHDCNQHAHKVTIAPLANMTVKKLYAEDEFWSRLKSS